MNHPKYRVIYRYCMFRVIEYSMVDGQTFEKQLSVFDTLEQALHWLSGITQTGVSFVVAESDEIITF